MRERLGERDAPPNDHPTKMYGSGTSGRLLERAKKGVRIADHGGHRSWTGRSLLERAPAWLY
jgi:hypothetical protein